MIRVLLAWLDRKGSRDPIAATPGCRGPFDRLGCDDDLGAACLALEDVGRRHAVHLAESLQYALATLLIAVGAKVMRRLAVLHARLERVHKSSRSDLVKLIAFRLSLPVFKLHDLLFQVAYPLSEFRLRAVRGDGAGLCGENGALQFVDGRTHLLRIADLKEQLRQLRAGPQRREEA